MTETSIASSQLFIDGRACPAGGGRTYPVHNPARPGKLVGRSARIGPNLGCDGVLGLLGCQAVSGPSGWLLR